MHKLQSAAQQTKVLHCASPRPTISVSSVCRLLLVAEKTTGGMTKAHALYTQTHSTHTRTAHGERAVSTSRFDRSRTRNRCQWRRQRQQLGGDATTTCCVRTSLFLSLSSSLSRSIGTQTRTTVAENEPRAFTRRHAPRAPSAIMYTRATHRPPTAHQPAKVGGVPFVVRCRMFVCTLQVNIGTYAHAHVTRAVCACVKRARGVSALRHWRA